MNMLKGKKTYILGAAAVVYGVVGFVMGWVDSGTAITTIWAGLAAMGLRAGISNG